MTQWAKLSACFQIKSSAILSLLTQVNPQDRRGTGTRLGLGVDFNKAFERFSILWVKVGKSRHQAIMNEVD